MVPFDWGLGDNGRPFGLLCLASKKKLHAVQMTIIYNMQVG